MIFTVGYGSNKREDYIKNMVSGDYTIAVLLAAVHFEWTIKRAILKLGVAPTKNLRNELEESWKVVHYKEIWEREIATRYKNAKLGVVVGVLVRLQNHGFQMRNKIVHGNGTISKDSAINAVDQYLYAAKKIRQFVESKGEDVDSRLKTRIKPRIV